MNIQPGQEYAVTVTKLLSRGIIVQINGTGDTEFVHISKLSVKFVSNIASLVHVGDKLNALCIQGKDKAELSLQHLHLESLNNDVERKKSLPHKTNAKPQQQSLDDMIAAAERDLHEKQRITDSRLRHRRKPIRKKGR